MGTLAWWLWYVYHALAVLGLALALVGLALVGVTWWRRR